MAQMGTMQLETVWREAPSKQEVWLRVYIAAMENKSSAPHAAANFAAAAFVSQFGEQGGDR